MGHVFSVLKEYILEAASTLLMCFHFFVSALPTIILILTFVSIVIKIALDIRAWKRGENPEDDTDI